MRRNHLAKDDLDWLPERYRLLRGAIIGGVWSGIGGLVAAMMWSGAHIVVFGKIFVVLGAAGYWAGDRAAKALITARLDKLASGKVDLAALSNEQDGELVHVRGKVRAERAIASVMAAEPCVYRRTRVSYSDVQIVDEEAVDFQLVDPQGNAIAIEVEGARLLVQDPKLRPTSRVDLLDPLAQLEPARRVLDRYRAMIQRGRVRALPAMQVGEVLLRAGDEVEAVGYKSRKVDPTVVDRLARETPMRATLRAGKDLPLILSFSPRAG
jgi:hypothetical protein